MTVQTTNVLDGQSQTTLQPLLKGYTPNFDLAVALTSFWMILGVFIDGWAHANLPETEETFFTPWHGVLYSGFFASASIIVFATVYNYFLTGDLKKAVPEGYGVSFLGVFIFFTGGALDMAWHIIIGIESDIEALFSPTHLTLMLGAFLITAGLLRKAVFDSSTYETVRGELAVTIAAVGAIGIMVFFAQFSHPYRSDIVTTPNAVGDFSYIRDGQQMMGFMWHSALLTGVTYYLINNFEIKSIFIGLFMSLQLALITILEPQFYLIPAAIGTGIATILLVELGKKVNKVLLWRVIGGLIPFMVFSLYYLNMYFAMGIGWSLDLWTGSLTVSLLVGILVSFLVYPLQE